MKTRTPRVRAVFCQSADEPDVVADLQRFRKKLFVDHLGWRLTTQDEFEIDDFDRPDTAYSALYVDDTLVGGFRAIRTDHEYLAQRIFPQLASLREYPRRRDAWEISRFGISPQRASDALARMNYGLMFRFACERQASALVAIADLAHERYLRAIGIRTRRYGPPQIIGTDGFGRDLVCVAGEIPLTDQAGHRMAALVSAAHAIEVYDATLVRGSAAISA